MVPKFWQGRGSGVLASMYQEIRRKTTMAAMSAKKMESDEFLDINEKDLPVTRKALIVFELQINIDFSTLRNQRKVMNSVNHVSLYWKMPALQEYTNQFL